MHSPGMQPSSFHDFLGCREGFGFLAEDCLPHLRGSATSIAPVECAVKMPIEISCSKKLLLFGTVMMSLQCLFLCTLQDLMFFLRNFEFLPVSFQFTFCHFFITNAHALPGQLDVGSGPVKM